MIKVRGFLSIWRKTFVDLTGPLRTLGLILVGSSIPLLVSLGWRWNLERLPLPVQTHYLLGGFLSVFFVWVAGLFLAITVATAAAGFISKESTEGTLLLLVSKPIHRWQIVLAKFLALVLHALLLEAIILLLLVVIFWFLLPLEVDIFVALLRAIPWLVLYSLVVTLLFGSLSLALSTLMKSMVKIMGIGMVLVFFVFLFGFMANIMFPRTYAKYHLYYVDINHHLGNIFLPLAERVEGGQIMSPYYQVLLFFTRISQQTESLPTWQYSDLPLGGVSYPAELTSYVAPVLSVVVWLAIVMLALGLAVVVMERKDVH